MKVVLINKPCSAEQLRLSDISVPAIKPGWVLISVEAFGINHSEILLRKFEVARPYIKTPIVPGIECVGIIADSSDSDFKKGQRVMALMGGMGRSFDGSYAEYVLVPTSHVFRIDSVMESVELAAIPESFYTAYGSLTESLQLNEGDLLLIRGGTSTVGLAAIQLAKAMGATVVATTRNDGKKKNLIEVGADEVILEGDYFKRRFLEAFPAGASKVLELIGAATIKESLLLTSLHGMVCHTGLLGGLFGLKDFDPIKEIPSGVYLTGFYSNRPDKMQIEEMMRLINKYEIHPVIAATFSFDEISKAHALAESAHFGKIVVKVDECSAC